MSTANASQIQEHQDKIKACRVKLQACQNQIEVQQREAEHLQGELLRLITQSRIVLHVPVTNLALEPGELYAGLILGPGNQINHHLILLPDEAVDVDWQGAKDWVKNLGGELPTRQELALLFANCSTSFQPRWYWSCQENESDNQYVDVQSFESDGFQDSYHKCFQGCVKAVRRIAIKH